MKRRVGFRVSRPALVAIFGLALAWAQFRESGSPQLSAHLSLVVEPLMPARVYLFKSGQFKNGQPFRLSPVHAVLPPSVDEFYYSEGQAQVALIARRAEGVVGFERDGDLVEPDD